MPSPCRTPEPTASSPTTLSTSAGRCCPASPRHRRRRRHRHRKRHPRGGGRAREGEGGRGRGGGRGKPRRRRERRSQEGGGAPAPPAGTRPPRRGRPSTWPCCWRRPGTGPCCSGRIGSWGGEGRRRRRGPPSRAGREEGGGTRWTRSWTRWPAPRRRRGTPPPAREVEGGGERRPATTSLPSPWRSWRTRSRWRAGRCGPTGPPSRTPPPLPGG